MKQHFSIDQLQETWQLASQLHEGQKYGGKEQGEEMEYIHHIGSVAFEILAAIPHTDNMNASLAVQCAVLHDSIEDTGISFDRVQALFGSDVAEGVMALTKNEGIESKEDKMRDSLSRIRQQPKEIWAVKLADRICNLYAPPFYWEEEKKAAYMQEAMLIYDELKEGNSYLAERLKTKIEAYKQFLV